MGDVLEEALFITSLLIKPSATLYKALQADRRRAQPSLWVDGVTKEIKAVGSSADKALNLAVQAQFKITSNAMYLRYGILKRLSQRYIALLVKWTAMDSCRSHSGHTDQQ